MSIADHVTQIYTSMVGVYYETSHVFNLFREAIIFQDIFFSSFCIFLTVFAQHLLFISDKADPPPTTGNKIRRCLHI